MEIKCSVFTQNLRVFWTSTVDFFVYGKCGYYTDLFGGKYRIFQLKLYIRGDFISICTNYACPPLPRTARILDNGGQRLLSQKQLQILFHRSDSGDAELFYQHVRHAGA